MRSTSTRSSPCRCAGRYRTEPTRSNGASYTARRTVRGASCSSSASSTRRKEAESNSTRARKRTLALA
eukprot:7355870-Alexandrium_andersonii.AAC.1